MDRFRKFYTIGQWTSTVLPTKSDSDVMFFLQSYQWLLIDRLLKRTQVIYRFALAQVEGTSECLLNNCKQNITSLSLFAGMTVYILNHCSRQTKQDQN